MPEHYTKPDGLEHLYTECFDMLYKLACCQLYQRTGSAVDAADVVQSVFLIAAQK